MLGDAFDLFAFHNEFRVDSQESATPWTRYGANVAVQGVGNLGRSVAPCGARRLKGRWVLPVWMHSDHVFGNYCRCHWRRDLHLPAAFPWHADEAGPRSLMGGRYWRDNGDGTFTPLDGDKEVVTIEQVVAAEGPRIPSAARSQKDFNAGFVYLLEPGRKPTGELLLLHAAYRDQVQAHWRRVTGERSRITTFVPRGPALTPEQEERYNETWRILTDAAAGGTAAAAGAGIRAERAAGAAAGTAPFIDHPIRPGRTSLRTVHLRELRERIAVVRAREGLPALEWTDPTLTAGVTPVRRVHLTELRAALDAVYDAVARSRPSYTDATVTAGTTAVEAVHVMELRAAVLALE